MAINVQFNGQDGRNFSPAPVPKGMSALDVVIQAGYLPTNAGPVEFAAWLRAPVDALVNDLSVLVQAELDVLAGPIIQQMFNSVVDAQAARDAALAAQTAAEAARDIAVTAKNDAVTAKNAAEAAVASLAKATTADILVGTNDTKYMTPLGNKAAMAWYAIPTGYTSPYGIDWNNGLNQMLTVNKTTTLTGPTNPVDGQTYGLKLAWTGTGSVTLPSTFKFGTNNDGSTFTPSFNSANGKVDYVWVTWDATLGEYRAQFSRGS